MSSSSITKEENSLSALHLLISRLLSDFDPDEGNRARAFLDPSITLNLSSWLQSRKIIWKKKRGRSLTNEYDYVSKRQKRNDDYDETYDNDSYVFDDPEDGSRHSYFLDPTIQGTYSWIVLRKATWRNIWRAGSDNTDEETYMQSTNYKSQKRNDSRNIDKHRSNNDDIFDNPEEGSRISHFVDPTMHSTFSWIALRKASWRNIWRARSDMTNDEIYPEATNLSKGCFITWLTRSKLLWKKSLLLRKLQCPVLVIGSEKKQKCPRDILPIFDPRLGLPDDVVAYALTFLPSKEHINLLCINKATSRMIKTRDYMWRGLCPTHWSLPKRPRKPWYQFYFSNLYKFEERKNKRSDDLLIKASDVLAKGDYLQTFSKIVCDGEHSFGFEVDYTSGTVEERNSLLNLAVINGRHKCVRWLIEVKYADIETSDRGLFTPLCNAGWNGDIQMVRYLLRQGARRNKIAKFHSSSGIAPKHEGLTPEAWARKRGHHSIADLIRIGL